MTKDKIERVARWFWRYHANQGEMVGDYLDGESTWRKEAKKLIRIIEKAQKEKGE